MMKLLELFYTPDSDIHEKTRMLLRSSKISIRDLHKIQIIHLDRISTGLHSRIGNLPRMWPSVLPRIITRGDDSTGFDVKSLSKNKSGWWLSPAPLKNMKVSWGDEIPNIWKKEKHMFETTNQQVVSKPSSYSIFSWSH